MTNNEKIINDLRLDRENLLLLISKLQSNWNSLREWLEVNDRYSQGYFKQVLEYMNELEGKDKG